MKLLSIKLVNYRSYYGTHELAFASKKGKNVTLIHGAMGAGKTKLFSAIQWCFYGEEEYDEIKSTNQDIINSIAREESKKNKSSETLVEIIFEHEKSKYHSIRKFESLNGNVEESTTFILLKAEARGDYKPVDDPEVEMNLLLSKNLRKYFMFDGEKIQNYSKYGHEIEIQRAIKGLLGFDDIENTIEILGKIDADYNKDIKRSTKSRELQDVIDKVETIKKAIIDHEQKIKDKEEEILKGQKLIQKLDKEQAAIAQAKEYIEKQDKLKELLASRDSKRSLIREEIKGVTETVYVTMLGDVLSEVDGIYNSLEQKGEIPAPIRAEFIKKLLKKEECICKRPLKKSNDNKAIDALLKLFEKQNTKLDNLVTKIPSDLAEIKTESEITRISLLQKLKEDSGLQDEIQDISDQLKEISDFLKDSDAETVALKEKEKIKTEEILKRKQTEKIKCEIEKERLEEELSSYEKTKKKLLENETETDDLRSYQSYTSDIKEQLNALYKIYEKETKEKVRSATQKIFSEFMWKKGHYKEVVIQDDYVLDVYDRNNRLAREGLSAGERQCFSLAFVIALARVTGKEAPFIVDTPLGRISKDPGELIDPRIQILKAIPNLLQQVILFVTYEEVREGEESDKAISPSVGNRYKLEYDEKNGCTRIIKL